MGENQPRISALAADAESADSQERASEHDQLRATLATASANSATVAQRLAGRAAMRDAAQRELERAEGLIAESLARAQQVASEQSSLAIEVDRLAVDAGSQHAELAELDAKVAPAEAALSDRKRALQACNTDLDAARRSRAEVEARLADARLTASRAEDRQERLFDQLRADSEWMGLDLGEQLELGASRALQIPRVEQLKDDAAGELDGLRRQMRAIGAIDRDALEAYEETADRHALLTEQEADLVKAEADLRQLLASLESQMQLRFQATFEAVSLAFRRFFPMLFGGGEAELVIETVEGETGGGGLEIMARPPGKRRQTLSLLSGGERALTAVALIFSLLEVSQTPFVVLDEVDAALDEANVERFCTALRSLAEHTQVVVITHNRGTIETAGTVYGVTMAEDGASQIISLRVDATA
jgi:chromosome segregation protein